MVPRLGRKITRITRQKRQFNWFDIIMGINEPFFPKKIKWCIKYEIFQMPKDLMGSERSSKGNYTEKRKQNSAS